MYNIHIIINIFITIIIIILLLLLLILLFFIIVCLPIFSSTLDNR